MNKEKLLSLLEDLKNSKISPEEALEKFRNLPFLELGEVVVDTHRELRGKFPEVIYGENKDYKTIQKSIEAILNASGKVLVTRIREDLSKKLIKRYSDLVYDRLSRTLHSPLPEPKTRNYVSIITAGSSDLPVAREAEIICKLMAVKVNTVYDVGVAGIHRLLNHIPNIMKSSCAVVVAGMEGALPGVIGGIAGIPVIGVPTSTGYGVSQGGFSALFTMLSSCALNTVVVNIDDGIGAGYTASLITLQSEK